MKRGGFLLKILDKKIGQNTPCFIIAEAGVNHNGDTDIAKKMIDIARTSGADAIKFQTFNAENIVTKYAEKAVYQKMRTGEEKSQYEMLKKLELSFEAQKELSDYSKKQGIIFLSTPFDRASVDFLDRLGVPAFKISSGEMTNFSLLEQVAAKKKPILLSTGMATLGEVEQSVLFLEEQGIRDLALLHCTTSYPAPLSSVNLKALETLRCAFKKPVGYSDHTEGIIVSLAAVAMGAVILEKHFTLDKEMPGPDHRASLNPDELKFMITSIRDVETALGNGLKRPHAVELDIQDSVRRKIVSSQSIKKGARISSDMLCLKRAGAGLDPRFIDLVIGRKIKCDIECDIPLSWDMIE